MTNDHDIARVMGRGPAVLQDTLRTSEFRSLERRRAMAFQDVSRVPLEDEDDHGLQDPRPPATGLKHQDLGRDRAAASISIIHQDRGRQR